jgi:hypothetical protein
MDLPFFVMNYWNKLDATAMFNKRKANGQNLEAEYCSKSINPQR